MLSSDRHPLESLLREEPPKNRFVAAVSAALLLAAPTWAGITEEDLANDAASTGDILTNGMGRDLQRYSPLDMVTKENVTKLQPV